MEEKETAELDLQTLKADFAVDIEEVLKEECSAYECALTDDNDIGVIWNFIVEDSISGFIGVEDNEEGLGVTTVTVGLHLKDITDYERKDILQLLEVNSELINASFSVAHFPVKPETELEQVFAEEGESIEFEDEDDIEPEMRDLLFIQTRIPLSVFEVSDFSSIIQNLMIQSDMALNGGKEDGEEVGEGA